MRKGPSTSLRTGLVVSLALVSGLSLLGCQGSGGSSGGGSASAPVTSGTLPPGTPPGSTPPPSTTPPPGTPVAPATLPSGPVGGPRVEGVDVSEFDGTIDWAKVKGAGIGFAFIRVSDGTQHPDPYFSANWSGAKAQGIVRSAYQFFRASESPTAQADLLVNAIGAVGAGDLPPVCDVEVLDGVSASTLLANLAAWIAEIQSKLDVTPIIYTGQGFWNGLGSGGSFSMNDLWVANWGVSSPAIPSDWGAWWFWQYTASGTVPGLGSGSVDRDVFNGSLDDLQAFSKSPPSSSYYRGLAVDSTGKGVWKGTLEGGAFELGDATFRGTGGGQTLAQPVLGIVRTPTGFGYWLFGADGNVMNFGDATLPGSLAGQALAKPIVGMTATPSGQGYWLLGQDGRVSPFGDAQSYGQPQAAQLTDAAVGIGATPTGKGYFIALADGNVLGFGDAVSVGGLGGQSLVNPIVSIAVTLSGKGYWLVDTAGSVTGFGDAAQLAYTSQVALKAPVVSITRTLSGNGYWVLAGDGTVLSAGDAISVGPRPR